MSFVSPIVFLFLVCIGRLKVNKRHFSFSFNIFQAQSEL